MTKLTLWAFALLVTACSSTSPTGSNATNGTAPPEDTSVGGLMAASVGGALSNDLSTPAGKASKNLLAALNPCPTLLTEPGPYCSPVNANTVDLLYISCNLADSMAQWTGTLQIGDATGVSCGAFPKTTLTRQFVTSLTDSTPDAGLRVANGITVELDHKTANLGNYEGDTIVPTIGAGFGEQVTWTNNVRTAVQVSQRIYSVGLFDHSLVGSVAISEAADGESRTATGTVTFYQNLLRVKGASTFNNVVYSNSCCDPISGSVTTVYTATSQSGTAGQALDGKSESITFTGCGLATFTAVDGTTTNVSLTQCY